MTDRDATTTVLRERLTDLLAEWGAEMSAVLTELERTRQQLAAADERSARLDQAVAEMSARMKDQDLVATLQLDIGFAPDLRRQLEARDSEVEQLRRTVEELENTIAELKRTAANPHVHGRPPAPESLAAADVAQDRTLAIDMRRALQEARRTAQREK